MEDCIILAGDCRDTLLDVPSGFVHSCITSPPYWGQRNYGSGEGEIGNEPTPEAYILALRDVFREVGRVLRDDGTLWLNLGDKYGPNKNLLGIPWRVALALQSDGWVLLCGADARHA